MCSDGPGALKVSVRRGAQLLLQREQSCLLTPLHKERDFHGELEARQQVCK